jgi:multiple sugar transport system permease protein
MSVGWTGVRSWLLLLPLLAVMTLIIGWPLIETVRISFTDARLVGGESHWVGLANFSKVLASPQFHQVLWTTILFVLISVTAEVVLGVLAALLLDQQFVGRSFLRALMILPWALPTVVNATMWRLIYNPDFGAFNALLTQTGLIADYRSWLGETQTALYAVCLADVWKNFPLVALIALAALQSVPRELKAAAIIDGAGPVGAFPHRNPALSRRPADGGDRAAHDRGIQSLRHHLGHDPRRPRQQHQNRQHLRLSGSILVPACRNRARPPHSWSC